MNPIVFHLFGPFSVSWYGVLVVTGISLFLYAAYSDMRRSAIVTTNQFFDCATAGVIGGLLGGKILYLFTQASDFSFDSWQEIAAAAVGGFAILGAIVGAFLGVLVMVNWYRIEPLPLFDLVGAYALLAHGIARLGCLVSGCCYGLLWPFSGLAIVYTHQNSLAPLGVPLFPVQLAMSLISLIGFVVCYRVYQIRGRKDGLVFCVYVLWESLARFGIDFFRGDHQSLFVGLSVYQYIALIMVACVCIFLYASVYHPRTRRRW